MTFIEHLEELRWHIIRALCSIVVFAVIAFLSKSFIFHDVILAPSRLDFWTYRFLCRMGESLGSDVLCIEQLPFIIQSRTMTGQFTMYLQSSLIIGLICAFPYAFWEIWRFISPGLHEGERHASRGAVFFVTILFLAGVCFGYYIVTPLSINFLSNYSLDPSILNEFDIVSYVSTVTMLVLSCAIMFQLPIVMYFLSQAGIVTPEGLVYFRKHAFVVILIISAILTPPDVMSQILIALPLSALYEFSIWMSRAIYRKKRKMEVEEFKR
ncbi:MAG: twin-arginine translocase subunit TatC [Cytophagales bacterium]|nr:twin-arginine translocase subunit TatC [Cytophagales bacterium]